MKYTCKTCEYWSPNCGFFVRLRRLFKPVCVLDNNEMGPRNKCVAWHSKKITIPSMPGWWNGYL